MPVRRPRRPVRRLRINSLEDRLAPATFTGVGPNLAIDLNSANETATFSTDGTTVTVTLTNGTANTTATGGNVTGSGTTTATFSSATYAGTITITDSSANTSVAFANSTGDYPQGFAIALNDPASGNVTFAGTSIFPSAVTAATTGGFIASDPGSAVLSSAGGGITLSALGHDIHLAGRLAINGQTRLTGAVIRADNPLNDFNLDLSLTNPAVASIFDVNDLVLGASTLAFGTLGQTTRIAANGNISQTGALTATAGAGTAATLDVASTAGFITLNNAGNNISSNVALAVSATGANGVTVVNAASLTLGDATLGTGLLGLTVSGNLTQRTGTTIQTDGRVGVTVAAANRDVLLNNAGNRIGGLVIVGESTAGLLRDFSLRNADDDATLPTDGAFTPFSNPGNIRNLTLFFDNNGITLPGYSISNNLAVTAGGDITQSAALTVPGTTTATVLGDFGIDLTNPANALGGAVGLNAPQSTQPVQVANAGALTLGPSNPGRGSFGATAVTGNISGTSAITQAKGAGPATFTVTAGTSVSLTGANDFPAGAVFAGAGLTAVNFRNSDFQARVSDLVLPATLTGLTVSLDNAPAVLPSFNLTNLTVTAPGIVQQLGSALTLTGTGTFSAGAFPLDLSNAGNDFTNLNVTNSGRNDVTVTDANTVAFSGNSIVGTGRLRVTAGGNITTVGAGRITQSNTGPVGEATLTSTAGSVTLTNNNAFRGPLSATVSAANTINIHNNVPLVLGSVTTGTGAFAADAGTQGISQDPNSVLSLGGPSSFTAGAAGVTLTNRTNTFGGLITLNAGNAAVRATGAVVLAAGNVPGVLSVKTGGAAADSVTQTGAITGGATATFDAGAGSVTLTNANNDFGSVSVNSTGPAASMSVTDVNALNVGNLVLGGGPLNIAAGGDLGLVGAASGIVQTAGAGAITFTTPVGSNVSLGSAVNAWRGPVTITHSADVTLQNQGDLTFTAASVVTDSLTATAGGTLSLPATVALTGNLSATAHAIPVGSNVTAGGAVSFTGAVNFAGPRAVTAAGNVTFAGDVTAGGALTFNLGGGQFLVFADGTWNQGANPLVVNGGGVTFTVGDGTGDPARFVMAGGTVALQGGGDLAVNPDGIFQVGTDPAAAETVTVANGAGALNFFAGALAVGLGAVNDQLVKAGDGLVQIASGSRLVGSELAGPTASPVLASQTELIVGRFANSVDADDHPRDFFAGSDIVTPAYSFTDVTVKAGGVAAPTGTATGTLPDGDRFTVKSSLGAAAGLATVVDVSGNLDVVVRNATAAGASTLTVSALGGGDGQVPVGGLAVHNPGAVTVTAPAANFTGDFTTIGTLTSLTARDLGAPGLPFTLTGGGPVAGSTSLTARVVRNTTATLKGSLKAFKAVSASNGVSLTAQKFGTLTTTGLAAAGDAGNFFADLTSTTAAAGQVVTAATVAGTLNGTWDVGGSVGTVKAVRVSAWTLGTVAGANVQNGGLLTNVTSLTFPGFVDVLEVNASGAVGTLTTGVFQDSHVTAGSWGTVKVTGSNGLVGSMINAALTATGNAGGVGLKSLSVAGDLSSPSVVKLLNGDATSIVVGRTISGPAITATDTGTRGALKAVTAGRLSSATIDARSVGTLTVKGNLAAGLFGDVTNSTVTARGNALGVGVGTVSASGSVVGSTFDVQSGNLTKLAVGRQLGTTTVRLPDPAFGTLGTIQAGDWVNGVTVLAETIGTVASVGAAAVLPASPLLLGGIVGDTITAYQDGGSAAAIGKLTAKGDLGTSTVTAERGIGTVTVGRTLSNSFIVADDAQPAAPAVGLVRTLTAGAVSSATVAANTLGTVKVTGYATPEGTFSTFVSGDVTAGTFAAAGGGAGVPGVASFAVAGSVRTNSLLTAPFGVKVLTVGGTVLASGIVAANPATPAAGVLTAVTVGDLNGTTVRAGSIGTLKTTGNVGLRLLGSVAVSTVATTAGGPQAIGTLTVAGDVIDSTLDAAATVGGIAVGGRVVSQTGNTRIQAGYNLGSKLGALTAGAWGQAGNQVTTDLVSRAVGTFALKGNAARGFVGTADRAFVDILGNAAGVGLRTFTGTGTAANSLFRVSDGDVGSFTVLRFRSSDLLVGFRPVKGSDLTRDPGPANWAATNHKLGAFTTTAAFDPADPADSASFRDSNVVAAILGTVSLSGVNPADLTATAFGVAYRDGAGVSAKGTVKRGVLTLTPPATDGEFVYLGLSG